MIPTGRQAVYISATHLMPNLEIETRSLSLKTKKYLVVCAASHLLIICVDSVGKSIVEFSESNKMFSFQGGQDTCKVIMWCNLPWDTETGQLLHKVLPFVLRQFLDHFHVRSYGFYEPVHIKNVTKIAGVFPI
jgi:hypothetical protein